MSFIFDPVEHTYKLDGVRLPSVTQVIDSAGRIGGKKFFSEFYSERGRAIHEAIRLDILDDLVFDSLHPEVKPFFDRWLEFKRDSNFKPFPDYCERPTYHPAYLYAGTPDLVGVINHRITVIDIKNGECPTARYQLAAYAGFEEIKVLNPDRFDLRLSPIKYRLRRFDDPNDWLVFLNDLNDFRRGRDEKNFEDKPPVIHP